MEPRQAPEINPGNQPRCTLVVDVAKSVLSCSGTGIMHNTDRSTFEKSNNPRQRCNGQHRGHIQPDPSGSDQRQARGTIERDGLEAHAS